MSVGELGMGLRAWRWWPWRRARRASPKPAGASAGTADATAEPLPEQSASGLTLGEATELLDLLERQGAQVVSVDLGPDARVSVRWVGAGSEPAAGNEQ
jgi:hypothetical protein